MAAFKHTVNTGIRCAPVDACRLPAGHVQELPQGAGLLTSLHSCTWALYSQARIKSVSEISSSITRSHLHPEGLTEVS